MNLLDQYQLVNKFGLDQGFELKVIHPGKIEYSMTFEERHLALPEVVHGGAIAGLMDAILSVAAFSAVHEENQHVATIEFKINYLKSIQKGQKVKGIGEVVKKGKRVIVTKGEIRDENDELLAVASGSIMPYSAS